LLGVSWSPTGTTSGSPSVPATSGLGMRIDCTHGEPSLQRYREHRIVRSMPLLGY
jgi:hypothetical protein